MVLFKSVKGILKSMSSGLFCAENISANSFAIAFFPVILLFFVIRCLIGRGLYFPEIFLIIFHIVFGLVEVLILLIYSCQHFFFVSFIVLRAFALFCLYSMQFLVVGSFLNFLKAAFLCWIAFLHSVLN